MSSNSNDSTVSNSGEFGALYQLYPLLRPAVGWLRREGFDPAPIVATALQDLRRRGRYPPRPLRLRYAKSVILGHFFVAWAKKHHGRTLLQLSESLTDAAGELKPFQLALMSAADEGAFDRVTPRLARTRMAASVNLDLGNRDDFAGFVATNTEMLLERFLSNFDPSRPNAVRGAVRYIQLTAVSSYLVRRTRPIQSDVPDLAGYLVRSPRLSKRTVLATKLAYLPTLLSDEERWLLRDEYGFQGSFVVRRPIKEIAEILGYKSASALYRKLYRVRDWCRGSHQQPPERPEQSLLGDKS